MIVTPVQATNLIQNGSFETATVNPGPFLQLNAGSTVITGWTVSQGSIDYIGTYWQASDGGRSLDMQGIGSGKIEQTFNTTIGATYRVTFDLAGNTFGGSAINAIKQMRVSAGVSSADFSFDITGKSPSNMGWVSKSWDFTANSTTTTLGFIGINSGDTGAALDNVSVIAVPEPSSMLGLLGLGVLGIGSALKRQS
ncbi:MAG: choice-of-anchor C family protein [Microcystis novacekii Mn_MB_F_20050700_S1]|uniref:Choice-of-anchor C family protein n=1 Tax=Microcystis novacekii Mn_MB_F_20050700_S1D TaxID=2486266 RepID=A0A552J820_9CHRO|nr:MAG: choice-of-anchor C family protein [Microcystis novacekii Mn_MB_F_20050700_S1]TRU91916.1 MAG: choice-of-anchor C family protein [Microcystis novacekii Mn_MB_F_20050700_S1D]